ncbi:MAG: metallophosphoesterase family protein [Calditrichaceae bacterium]|nr:metallophosphoesterase family protein [Calditrichaceae bacterium]RQV96679.1 MAG: metallophosphoesterase [Calditrichota bacterium]
MFSAKIALISDIHGNYRALHAVMQDIEKRNASSVYDLGDSLYGPLEPAHTFELIQKFKIQSICGNQDRIIIRPDANMVDNPTYSYVINQLPKDALNWIKQLPPNRSVEEKLFLCHGAPVKDDDYLLEKVLSDKIKIKGGAELDKQLSSIAESIICCGHSHKPNIVKTETKTIINPGSVGLPAYDDDQPYYHTMENYHPNARYCIVELINDTVKVDQISVPYDYEKAARKAEQNNRPDWALWLRTGRCKE